jgi:hypothetical protein
VPGARHTGPVHDDLPDSSPDRDVRGTPGVGSPDPSSPAANRYAIARTGLILLGLIGLQAFTLINVGGLIFMHISTGVGILVFVVVKMRSVTRRFVRYYRKDADYRKAGPPVLLARVMAPFLVLATVALLLSGIWILVSQGDAQVMQVHETSFVVWLVLVGLHLVIYVPKLRGILRLGPSGLDPQA